MFFSLNKNYTKKFKNQKENLIDFVISNKKLLPTYWKVNPIKLNIKSQIKKSKNGEYIRGLLQINFENIKSELQKYENFIL